MDNFDSKDSNKDGANWLLSIITPAFNEEHNLPILYQRLQASLDGLFLPWEWIIVDDHSSDGTFAIGAELARRNHRIRVYRLSRNFGSHAGIICGLDHALGDCSVVMAADLQDTPETIPALIDQWRAGSHIVWAVRDRRDGENWATLYFAKLYYLLMRKMAGLQNIPAGGADFFLIDRRVVEAVRTFNERNASLFALIAWAGFKQTEVHYDKQARVHGRTGWTVRKKLKLVVDSLTSFTFFPIRWLSGIGVFVALCGLLYALIVILNAMFGKPAEGWSSLMVVVLIIGGSQMIMLGALGEYLWRTLDEARRRPRYILEASFDERDETLVTSGHLAARPANRSEIVSLTLKQRPSNRLTQSDYRRRDP